MILRNTNITCIWRIQSHKNTTLKSSSGRQNSGESSPYLHGGRLPLGCRDRRVPLSSLWYLQPWALDAYRFLVARGLQGHRGDSHHRFRCGCKAAGCWNPQKRQVKSMVKYTQWLMIDVKFDRLVKFSSPNCPIQRLLLGSQFLRSSLRPCLPSSLLRLPFMLKTAGVEGKVVGNSDLTYNYIIS